MTEPLLSPDDGVPLTPPAENLRYVVSHLDVTGTRVLAHPMQGRYTYDTPEAAQLWIDDAMRVNARSTLESLFGLPLEVRAVECWPVHNDPKGVAPLFAVVHAVNRVPCHETLADTPSPGITPPSRPRRAF